MTRASVALLALAALGGCASLAEGTIDQSREMLATSSPSGAAVSQGGRTLCHTPCSLRQQQLNLTRPLIFTFASGRAVEADLTLDLNGEVLGNVLVGGPLGVAIDTVSGRAVKVGRRVHAVEPGSAPAGPVAADDEAGDLDL